MADENSFMTALSSVVRIPGNEIADSTAIEPADWDSVQLLELIAAIDESFGVTVNLESLKHMRTVGELQALIRNAMAG